MDTMETKGGGRIRRYDKATIPPRRGRLDDELMAAMVSHVAAWLSPDLRVASNRDRDPIHLSWLLVGPGPSRPFCTVVTVGMASAPMIDPEERNGRPRWGELFILMPPDWRFEPLAPPGSLVNWPLDLTGDLARLPHMFDSVLWSGHTFEYDNPPGPIYDGLPFHGVALCESDLFPPDFHVVPMRPGKEIRLHCVLPIHEAEMRFAKDQGVNALIDRLSHAGVPDVVDCSRESVCS